ncbi:hypothetical protein AFLA_010396 [Aspergillus flavus NRRL3357]|nr:hypothetical protein AFLA_010396 [Aspergillus flavus NRRL3357]
MDKLITIHGTVWYSSFGVRFQLLGIFTHQTPVRWSLIAMCFFWVSFWRYHQRLSVSRRSGYGVLIENQAQSGACPRLVLEILPVIGQDIPAPISVGHEIVRLGGETLNTNLSYGTLGI